MHAIAATIAASAEMPAFAIVAFPGGKASARIRSVAAAGTFITLRTCCPIRITSSPARSNTAVLEERSGGGSHDRL